MGEATIIGQNFHMGGVSVTSRYDRAGQFGYLNMDVESESTPDQRRAAAMFLRQFADELEQ